MSLRLPPYLIQSDLMRSAAPTVEMEWELTDTLFSERGCLVAGTLVMVLVAGLAWARDGRLLFPAWAALGLAVLGGRLCLARAYHRANRTGSPRVWARRFAFGAWAAALLWGLASFVMIVRLDPFQRLLVVAVQAGGVGVAATRNHASPAAAQGQVLLTLVPLVFACLATLHPFYAAFAIAVVLQILTLRGAIAQLGAQTVRLFATGQEKAALAADLIRLNRALQDTNLALSELVVTDELTSLANRRGFLAALNRQWRRARRQRTPLSLMMIDVDHFKAFNDHYGHQEGDTCLRLVGTAIAGVPRRSDDLTARYGGEEFAVLMPETDREAADRLAEAVRRAVEKLAIPHEAADGDVTVSVGVATMLARDAIDGGVLVSHADRALYRAKQAGRNRVCRDDPVPPEDLPSGPSQSVSPRGTPRLHSERV
jgi:diguanylate cyclase (GGDEF)-like protein